MKMLFQNKFKFLKGTLTDKVKTFEFENFSTLLLIQTRIISLNHS